MLMAGVFVSNTASAAATNNGCPSGFQLANNGTTCFRSAKYRTETSGPSCDKGKLTPSKTVCFVDATLTPQTRTDVVAPIVTVPPLVFSCPKGSTSSGFGPSLVCTPEPQFDLVPVLEQTEPGPLVCPPGSQPAQTVAPTDTPVCFKLVEVTETVPVIVRPAESFVTCPTGFTKSFDPVACTRTIEVEVPVPAEQIFGLPTYTCPAEYTLRSSSGGGRPDCVQEVEQVETVAPVGLIPAVEPRCPDGFLLEAGGAAGIQCVRRWVPETLGCGSGEAGINGSCVEIVAPIIPTPDWTCPSGTEHTSGVGQNMVCVRTTVTFDVVPAIEQLGGGTWVCPTGSFPTGGSDETLTCARTSSQLENADPIVIQSDGEYRCPDGSVISGEGADTVCTVTRTESQPVDPVPGPDRIVYRCPAGTIGPAVEGGTCKRPLHGMETVPPIVFQPATVYSCPLGFTGHGSGPKLTCRKVVQLDPSPSCPSKVTPRDAGNGDFVCILGPSRTSTHTVAYCPTGALTKDKTECYVKVSRPNNGGGRGPLVPKYTG